MRLLISIALVLFGLTFTSCHVQKKLVEDKNDVHKNKLPSSFQERHNFVFNEGKLIFSNKFLSARLNRISQLNDSSFNIFIEPENYPINPSPWYAFKVWSKNRRNIFVSLHYQKNKHRYNPKLSRDNFNWINLNDINLNSDSSIASFKLEVCQDSLIVAAQPIISSVISNNWVDSISRLPFMRKEIIGQSLLGKPILALHNINSNGKNIVIVISRQHPPEVTGYLAMQEFVRTLMSKDWLATQFRKKFEMIIVPMVNPDGVDEGNWRFSAAGVDLNRDWISFEQPETRAVRNYILKKIFEQKALVHFALDFHSTWEDVLYTNSDTLTNFPGLTRRWIDSFEKKIKGNLKVRASGNGSKVSKSWFMRELKADALTYEVGDNSSIKIIKEKGHMAAVAMMQLLMDEK